MSQLTLHCFLFLRLLRCFSSAGTLLSFNTKATAVYAVRFPHSEISGSNAAQRLPEAYLSYATSFIAVMCQGIHHTPLNAINRPSQRLRYNDRDILLLACFIVWNYQTTFGGIALGETKTASRGLYDTSHGRGVFLIPLSYLSVPMSIAMETIVSSTRRAH